MATAASPTSREKLAITIDTREKNKMDAARLMVATPMAMLALGALARSGLGLRELLSPQKLPSPSLLGKSQFIQLPRTDDDKDSPQISGHLPQAIKTAADPFTETGHTVPFDKHPSNSPLAALYDPLAKLLYNNVLRTEANAPTGGIWSWIKGDGNMSPSSVPLAGLALPAGVAALYGGWQAVDQPLDNRRKSLKKQELAEAKERFDKALQGKFGAADTLDAAAEAVDEALEKSALTGKSEAPAVLLDKVSPVGGLDHLTGYYGALLAATALTSALGAGAATYGMTNKQSKRKTLEEALRRRAKQQAETFSPIFAYAR